MQAVTPSPAALAAATRKYAVESSCSLDPYEEPPIEADDVATIQEWLAHVEETMRAHRSPFIAAEVLLREMEDYAQERMHRPERLYVATAIPVLNHCLPAFGPEHRGIIAAALRELGPAMAFTKSPAVAASNGGTAVTRRVSYAECFWRVYGLFLKHKRTMEVHARRAEVETAVMDRVVLSLDRLWVKMCFLSWKIHCRQIREKKLLFKKLAHRGMAGHIVPRYIRAWRQHAHSVMLTAKVARSSEVAKELEALYPQEQHAKSLHERLNAEVREKMRLLKEETARAEQTRAKLDALKVLHEETEQSLHSHWRTWRACMLAMFGDCHPINKALEEDFTNHVTYQQNITDTAELYSKRARARTGKVGLKQIQACLQSQGFLTAPEEDGTEPEDLLGPQHTPRSVASRRHSHAPVSPLSANSAPAPGFTPSGRRATAAMGPRTKYVKVPQDAAPVNAVVDALRLACAPVVSPLRLIHLLRGHQAFLNATLSFVSCMYSGGHCSLFWPPLTAKPAAPSPAATRTPETPSLASHGGLVATTSSSFAVLSHRDGADANPLTSSQSDGGRKASVAAALDVAEEGPRLNAAEASLRRPLPDGDLGAHLLADVNAGMAQVHLVSEGNDRHLLCIRRCMEANEVDAVQDYLSSVFARWSTMGLPLNGDKVVKALMPLVRPVDGPVIQALYPSTGIHNFTEFSEYAAKISEFSSIPPTTIAERLENGFDFSPREAMLYTLHTSEDVRAVLRDSHEYLVRLLDWAKDPQRVDLLSADRVHNLLVVKLGLSEEVATRVCESTGATRDAEVSRDELSELLYLAAGYVDPSPFTSPAEKLAVVLDRCVPFLLDL